jgi:hypothetical protein
MIGTSGYSKFIGYSILFSGYKDFIRAIPIVEI